MKSVYSYLGMMLVFTFLDLLWLGIFAKNFYQKHLGYLLADKVNWAAAMIFYLIFILGILLFVVIPGKNLGVAKVLGYGALFGIVTFAAYDLTNLATIKQWPFIVTIVDLAWGAIICACVSFIGRLIIRN